MVRTLQMADVHILKSIFSFIFRDQFPYLILKISFYKFHISISIFLFKNPFYDPFYVILMILSNQLFCRGRGSGCIVFCAANYGCRGSNGPAPVVQHEPTIENKFEVAAGFR
jgi:hypothetical protein